MLSVNNVCKRFGDFEVIDNISIEFSDKGVTVIVGINGIGKTTFLNILVGLLEADEGEVYLKNLKVSDKEYKEKIYYLPSDFYLPEYMTGKEYAKFILSIYPNSSFDIFDKCSRLFGIENALKKTLESYSFGMKKKLQIALAISACTPILIGDEVFSGLDFETTYLVKEIFSILARKKKIILVSHEEEILTKFSNDILLLNKGKLTKMSGTPSEIIESIKTAGDLDSKVNKLAKYFKTI